MKNMCKNMIIEQLTLQRSSDKINFQKKRGHNREKKDKNKNQRRILRTVSR